MNNSPLNERVAPLEHYVAKHMGVIPATVVPCPRTKKHMIDRTKMSINEHLDLFCTEA